MKVRTRLATGLTAAAALTATGFTVAHAGTPSPTSVTSTAASFIAAQPAAQPAAPPARRTRLLTAAQRTELRTTGHVTATRHTKKRGDVTLDLQVGRVMAATPTSITVHSRSGYHHTYAITGATKVRERRAPVPASALKPGDHVLVVATTDDVARRIIVRPLRHAPAPTTGRPSSDTPSATT